MQSQWLSCRFSFAFILIFILPSRLTAETIAAGSHFRIVCHFDNRRIADNAMRTAEAVWPVAVEFFKTGSTTEHQPLEIHLYRELKSYQEVESRLTKRQFRENHSFSHYGSKSAHIALQPPCTKETLQVIGLPALTRSLIAHEAAHLFTYQTFTYAPSLPDWLSEGAAMWISYEALQRNNWTLSYEDNPETSTYLFRLQRLILGLQLPTIQDVFDENIQGLNLDQRYALYWELVRFLRNESRALFETMVRKATRLKPGAKHKRDFEVYCQSELKKLGSYYSINRRFRGFIERECPQWNEARRSLDVQGARWTQIAFPGRDAIAWKTVPAHDRLVSIGGTLEILVNEGREMQVLFGAGKGGHVRVSFVEGTGLKVSRRDEDGRHTMLAEKKIAGIQERHRILFQITVRPSSLQVEIDGRAELTCPIPLDEGWFSGIWGLGAGTGAAGIWRDIEMRANASQSDTLRREREPAVTDPFE